MGVVSQLLFCGRNAEKCIAGDKTRGAVSACQLIGSADTVSASTSSIFKGGAEAASKVLKGADTLVEKAFEKAGSSEALDKIVETTGANTKIGAVAQKVVNPLLCVSAGVRVLKDEDQYAALIEETSAMGMMFGCEAVMKYARNAITNSSQSTTGLAGVVTKAAENSSTIKNVAKKASEWFEKLGTTKNGNVKQTLVKAGIDVLFVGGSILAYNAGKKLAECISNREEK